LARVTSLGLAADSGDVAVLDDAGLGAPGLRGLEPDALAAGVAAALGAPSLSSTKATGRLCRGGGRFRTKRAAARSTHAAALRRAARHRARSGFATRRRNAASRRASLAKVSQHPMSRNVPPSAPRNARSPAGDLCGNQPVSRVIPAGLPNARVRSRRRRRGRSSDESIALVEFSKHGRRFRRHPFTLKSG